MIERWKWKIAQWFEIRWWQSYLRNKDKEQYLSWKKKYWQDVLNQISDVLEIKEGQRCLDMGCGPAGIYSALPDLHWVAVDPLINSYERQTTFFCQSDYPKVCFVQSAMEHFAVDTPFDIAFCFNAVNHVADIEVAFDQLKKCMKPGGKLVLSIDAHNHSIFKYLFRWIPGDVLHPHQYDKAEYKHFLQQRDLKILKEICLKREFIFSHEVLVAENDVTKQRG